MEFSTPIVTIYILTGPHASWASATGCETEENHDGTILITAVGIDKPLRVLVDTGAQISVLKQRLIPDNIPICADKQYEIAGITMGSIKTLGTVNLTLHDVHIDFR
jgi:hypothetical protein